MPDGPADFCSPARSWPQAQACLAPDVARPRRAARAPYVAPREAGRLDARPAQGAAAASVWVVDAAAREPASAAPGARAAVVPGFLAQASGAALEPGVLTPVAGHSDVEREGQAAGVAQSELLQAGCGAVQDAAVA